MRIYDRKEFWNAHYSSYVSMYMKHDFFTMEKESFCAKYMNEWCESKLPEKRKAIIGVLKIIWTSLNSVQKYNTLSKFSKGNHYADVFHNLFDLSEVMRCNMIKKSYEGLYWAATNKNYETNHFVAYTQI